jgi:uncharacterized protein YbjQ (UPF0145 family)
VQSRSAPTDETSLREAGRERLQDTKDGLFTSDLTVNEYLLLEDAGYEPLGLVLGSSIYHVGFQRRRLGSSHELTVPSQALYHARELAMQRMQTEAEEIGADGVVGVHLDFSGFAGASHIAEFVAVGTAVRERDRTSPPADGRPFTSDLSGQDFWTLLRTGARPVGLVLGSCVYSVAVGASRVRGARMFSNVELPALTQALYDARELAMTRMQHEAKGLAADGIVGVRIHEHRHSWGGRAIEFVAIGTAIVRGTPATPLKSPMTVLDLNDTER